MLRRILIIDDSGLTRQLLKDVFSKDYEVWEAENGEIAYHILFQHYKTISAILLDLIMPEMDGFELMKRMGANPMLSQIPIIVITGNDDEETQIRALSLGANDFISKPYNFEILGHRLRNLIHTRETAAFVRALQKDELTGLYNRKAFFDVATRMINAQDPGYYVMTCFDINKFKVINDQYGSEKGDDVLKYVARIFKEEFTPLGGICGRITADDFAVLYPASLLDSDALAQIRNRASLFDNDLMPIGFSIGRYIIDDLNLPVGGMYDRALLAQATAKGSFDHNIVTYDEAMRERLIKEQQITSVMKTALETDQFEVWFQPQYNHATGALIGAEVLTRWRQPQDGQLIPPNDFIPVFERNGFIYEMDKYIWEKSCMLLRRWIDKGYSPLPLSVNVSRYDALQPDFIQAFTGIVEKYELPVDLLRIEITESAFAGPEDRITDIVKCLIGLGFTVEIDDFGSGYSSLNTLKDVPAQILKLDMRFLENSEDTDRGGNVLESVVRMAKWLGMAVIAEGVEKIEQADYLKSIGCTYVQGYLYAKPMPVDEYEAHFRSIDGERRLTALQTVHNLDNSAFWDPMSMDTLIFNSFVGSACIMEYHAGHLEVLRATDRFIQMLDSDTMTVNDALKLDWVKYTEEASAQRFKEAVYQSINTNDEITVEVILIKLPGCPAITHLRITLRVIATAGDHYLVYSTNENITKQREFEEKERKSNEQLQTIMANIHGSVTAAVVRDGYPQFLFVNEQFYSMQGYTKEQYEAEVGFSHSPIHPDDRERLMNEIKQASVTDTSFSTIYRIIRRDGAVRWLQSNIAMMNLPDVDELVQLSVSSDITDLREAEEKERSANEQLQAIMENINGGVYVAVTHNGLPQVQYANELFYKQRGYTKEQYEAEVASTISLVHPDDIERVQRVFQNADRPFSVVYRLVRRDGCVCWLQNNITFVRLPGYDAPVHLSVTNDITEMREAEERERAAAVQLQAIMDNINGGIALTVMRNGFPKVLFANEQFYAQRGYTKEQYEAEITDSSMIFHPDDMERASNKARTAVGSHSEVYRIVCRDGTVRWMQNNITEVDMPGYNEPVKLSVSNDITELRQAERKEHEVSERLQAILAALNSGVSAVTINDNGKVQYIFANDLFYSMLGLTREQFELKGSDVMDLIHPDDKARIKQQLAELIRNGGTTVFEYRVIRPDNETIHLRVNASLLSLDGVDKPVVLGVSSDVTDMVKAQRKISDLSERMQSILGALNCGVSAVSLKDGKIDYIFANDKYYSLLGYTREQFDAEVENSLDIIHPDDRERVQTQVERLFETGVGSTIEYRVMNRSGEILYLQVNISLLRLDGVEGWVNLGVTTDITDMVRARQQISSLSERMQAVLENVDCGITATEIDGTNVGYLFCNDRFYDINGYTKAQYEAEVHSPFELIHPDDRQEIVKRIAQINNADQNTVLEYRIIRRDGQVRWMHTAITVRRLSDASLPVQFAAYSDITDEKQTQERIRQANKQMQAMMDDMPGGFARLRVLSGGNVVVEYVNDNYCRMVGMSRREITSAGEGHAMDTTHPDDVELVRSTVRQMVETGETRSIKYRLRHADGSYISYSVFARVTSGLDGAKYINVYYAELSEQEKKEQIIRETVPFVLSAILASSTSLAFAKDMDSRYICASREFVKITNYASADDIIGKTDYEIFPKEVADTLRDNDRKVLETNLPMLDYVQALPAANGALRYYKLSKYILRDTYGNMLGIYAIGRDITDEKSAYERLKLLVDSIPGGIASYIASPSGIRITYFNDGFCNIMGYTRDEYERISATGIGNLTFAQDISFVLARIDELIRDGTPLDCTYRVHTKSGGYKWVNLKGSVAERHGDVCLFNTVLYDVTERIEAENALRLSEEQFRIAADIGGRTVARYDIPTGVYHHQSRFLFDRGFGDRIENVPQAIIDAGIIAPECIGDYLEFYDKIRRGESPCSVDIATPNENGEWRWLREDANVMMDADGKPSQAIIVFSDITELREKETVFKKWQQSLNQRPEEDYMLFRCNLSKNNSFDSAQGKLFWITFNPGVYSFNDRTYEYASQCVYESDRPEYLAFMNCDILLANYYRGVHTKTHEYREILPDGTNRWLRLTVELVEYPNSTDIEAFLLYENIDDAKRSDLQTQELAQTDPLTGVLNRASFSQAVERIIAQTSAVGSHVLMMLDIDTFKLVNDTLGHDMGDQVLKGIANTLRSILRHGDLLGRLGGDEFMILMRDVYDDEAIKKKAKQICSLLSKSLDLDLQTSTSIGIAVCPRDGTDFTTLYRKADTALYKVKASGKNNYAFFDEEKP